MFVKKLALVAVLAASAYAQDSSLTSSSPLPTSTSGLSSCVVNCASSSSLCTFTDASCVCSNTDYQTAVLQCLQQNCTADDIQAAEAAEADLCGNTSSSLSSLVSSVSGEVSSVSSRVSSVSSRISSLSSSRSSVTSSPTSTSGSGSSGAAGLSASLLATGGAVLLGVIGGGLLVF